MTDTKGRPTPKRSDSQQRRSGPVGPPPTNRKEAAARVRAQQSSKRKAIRKGTASGDTANMLPRDSGSVRALVRDVVDARRSLAPALLPVAIALPLSQLTHNPGLISLVFALWIGTILAVAMDMVLTGRTISRTVRGAFPEESKVRGHVGYGLMRTTTLRRLRRPKPRVKGVTLRKKKDADGE